MQGKFRKFMLETKGFENPLVMENGHACLHYYFIGIYLPQVVNIICSFDFFIEYDSEIWNDLQLKKWISDCLRLISK